MPFIPALLRLWALAAPWLGPVAERLWPAAANARARLVAARPVLIAATVAAVAIGTAGLALHAVHRATATAAATAATTARDAHWQLAMAAQTIAVTASQHARDLAAMARVEAVERVSGTQAARDAERILALETAMAAAKPLADGERPIVYSAAVARLLNAGRQRSIAP